MGKIGFLAGAGLVCMTVSGWGAVNGTWTAGGSPNNVWNVPGNWSTSPQFPSMTDDVANFTGNFPQPDSLGQDITIGTMNFNTSINPYIIGSQETTFSLTFEVSSGSANIVDALHTSELSGINCPIVLNSPLAVSFNLPSGIQQFAFSGPISGTGSLTAEALGNGMVAQIFIQGDCTYTGGTFFDCDPAAVDTVVIITGTLPVGGALDLGANGVVTVEIDTDNTIGDLTGSNSNILVSLGSTLTVGTAASTEFSGQISNGPMQGSLTKQGAGILTFLNANNNYTGLTTITDGTLQLAISGALSAGPLEVDALGTFNIGTLTNGGTTIGDLSGAGSVTLGGNTLTVGTSNSTVFSGVISDGGMGGSLTKMGSGLLNLTGPNTYTGATSVNEGRLSVNGSLDSSTTTVNTGAVLGGAGSLQGIVSVGGTVAPGNSIDNLTGTSLMLDGSTVTAIEVNPSLSSSLTISGPATIAGTVQVTQDAGSYLPSFTYPPFLSATSLSGTFDGVSGGLPGFTFRLVYGTNTVSLEYVRSSSSSTISTAGLSGNAAIFANYLNHSAPNSQATQLLSQLSGATLKNALNSSSPLRNAFGTWITQNILFGVSQLISSHLIDQRFFHTRRDLEPSLAALFDETDSTRLTADFSDRMRSPNPCEKYSFWFDGFGEYNHLKSLDQNPSFNAYSGAALLGFDFYGWEQNLFGLGAGYAYTHLIENHNQGSEKINYYIGNLYDTVLFSKGYLEFGVWGVYNQIHNYRHISFPGFDATASATIPSWQLVPHFGCGYHNSRKWPCELFAQFDCAINWQKSFREHGAGFFDMDQRSQTSELLRSEGGFRFYQSEETCWGAWMIMEKLSYVNLKSFGTGKVTAAIVGASSFFTLETFQGMQNLGSAGLEFLWRFGKRKPFTVSFVYDGEWGSKYMSHEGMLKLNKDF